MYKCCIYDLLYKACLFFTCISHIGRTLPNSSTPDVSLKPRVSEASDLQAQQHNGAPYLPLSRTPFPAVTVDQSITTYSGRTAHWGVELQTSVVISVIQAMVTFAFTSHRKPNNSSLRYISQPPGLLGLLCHVTAVIVP